MQVITQSIVVAWRFEGGNLEQMHRDSSTRFKENFRVLLLVVANKYSTNSKARENKWKLYYLLFKSTFLRRNYIYCEVYLKLPTGAQTLSYGN